VLTLKIYLKKIVRVLTHSLYSIHMQLLVIHNMLFQSHGNWYSITTEIKIQQKTILLIMLIGNKG